MVKTFIYIKKDKARSNGDCPIYIKVVFNQKSTTVSTGKYISEERWKQTDNLRKLLRQDKEKTLKEFLDLFLLNIEKIHNQIERYQEDITIKEFKNRILGKQEIETIPTLIKIIEEHNLHFSKLVAIGERSKASLQKYSRVKDLIKIFNNKTFGCDDIQIDKINSAYIYNLESYLKFESDYKGKKGIRNNSVVKYFKNLKTICNYAIRMELIDKNPFNIYNGKIKVSLISQEVIPALIVKEEYTLLSVIFEKHYEELFETTSWSYKTSNSINLIGMANVNWHQKNYASAKNNLALVELDKVELGYYAYFSLFYYLTQLKLSFSENDLINNKFAQSEITKFSIKTKFSIFDSLAKNFVI